MASYERCVLVAFFSQARSTMSSLTLRRLSLILSASGADGSFSETILRYQTSLSESLGGRPDKFEPSILSCCCYSFTIPATCDFYIPVVSAISRQLLPSAFFSITEIHSSVVVSRLFPVTLTIGIMVESLQAILLFGRSIETYTMPSFVRSILRFD
jgi:hypothetical protein